MDTAELDVETVVDLITSLEQVGPLGLLLSDHAIRSGVSHDVAADLRLVAAELATNALEHGKARNVSVRLSIDDVSVQMSVAFVDAGVTPDPNDAVMPPPSSERGRGLALVATLSSTVVQSVIHGETRTVVTFDRAASPSS